MNILQRIQIFDISIRFQDPLAIKLFHDEHFTTSHSRKQSEDVAHERQEQA